MIIPKCFFIMNNYILQIFVCNINNIKDFAFNRPDLVSERPFISMSFHNYLLKKKLNDIKIIKMIANPDLYPAPSSAKVLLKRLIDVSNVGDNIDAYLFHGIINSNKKDSHHIYCYCISFLQMFLHCNDIIDYFYENKSLNKNEKLIHDIIESFFKKSNTKSINIYDFIEKWRGWNGINHLPKKMSDVSLFIRYFLKSLSNPIKELFKINVNSE